MFYLMIKKCMNTGLMYLCKTNSNKNPYFYKGSGIRWVNHIKKHNSYIITCVIGEYSTKEELKEAGLYFSKLFDVVNDYNWANLIEEKGDGGLIGTGQLGKTWKIRDTSKMKNTKTKTTDWYEGRKKLSGKNNYQFKGFIKTPWGVFESITEAVQKAKELRKDGNAEVISDRYTLRKYLHEPDTLLNYEGRRTPKHWRGKTPKELGFEITSDNK